MPQFEKNAELIRKVSDATINSACWIWVRNIIKNEESMRVGKKLESLRNRLRNIPVIIVGAGPSLDKNKNMLRAAKGRALILCVDTAYKAIRGIVNTPIH